MITEDFAILVSSLVSQPSETEWVEFKRNNSDPQRIGENISAISNASALHRQQAGYIVWGIENASHSIAGTTFSPKTTKAKGQELENWLVTQLEPPIDVRIHEGVINGKAIVVFEIQPTTNRPVSFKGIEYIRIGSCTKKLRDHPEKERTLWRLFDEVPFENGTAIHKASSEEVLSLIDYTKYFQLMNQPLPDNRAAILERLKTENIIKAVSNNLYDITNIGAVLFASDLQKFDRLARKALRVIHYKGNNRIEPLKEQLGTKGYAVGFEGAVKYGHL